MKNFLTLVFILIIFSWEAMTKQNSFLPSSFTSNYVKSYQALVGKKVIKTNGSLDYKYPSKLSLKYDDGSLQKTVVVNGKKVWDYTPPFNKEEKGELRVFKSQNLAILKFLDVLHNGLADNKMFKVTNSKNMVLLKFSATMTKTFDFVKAELFPKESVKDVNSIQDINNLIIYYANKKPETYTFKKITQKKFSNNHFQFKQPENTNVTTN